MIVRDRRAFGDINQTLEATKAVAELKLAYLKGAVQIGANPDNVARLIALGPAVAWLTDFARNDTQVQLSASYTKLGEYIDQWASTMRSWAERGQRDDGSAYSWEKWGYTGNEYFSNIKDFTKLAWDTSTFNNVIQTLKNFKVPGINADVPLWLKLLLGGMVAWTVAPTVLGMVAGERARWSRR